MKLCEGRIEQGNETWVKWEPRDWCTYRIGLTPDYHTYIGFALAESGERGVVIWPGADSGPVFIEARYAHYVGAAAVEAVQVDITGFWAEVSV